MYQKLVNSNTDTTNTNTLQQNTSFKWKLNIINIWNLQLWSWRIKLSILLCLKYCGNISVENLARSLMIKLRPVYKRTTYNNNSISEIISCFIHQ